MRLLLVVFAALAVPASAFAQSGSWPTTSWVLLERAGLSQEPVAEQDYLGTGFNAVRDELDASSAWLAGLGFRAPRLARARTGEYPAFVVSARRINRGQTVVIGRYRQPPVDRPGLVDRLLELNREALASPSFFSDGTIQGQGGVLNANYEMLVTPVHEVFHAVQASYPRTTGAPLDWIAEGTAEAVMLAWLQRRNYPNVVELGSYDARPLYEGSYNMAHFWLAVGKDLRSRDNVAFLNTFYQRAMGPATDAMPGVDWLDQNLQQTRLGGLRKYLPYFTARHLTSAEHFDDEDTVTIGADGTATRVVAQQKPLTVEAFRMTFPRPPELGRVKVSIEGIPPSAQIVIGGKVFAKRDGASKPEASVETTDEVCGTGTMCEIPVRVVNAAATATATPTIGYTVTFELDAECDFRYPTGVSGVAYKISTPGQRPKYIALHFPGAGAGTRKQLSGPFRARYLDAAVGSSADAGMLTTMEGEMICNGGALDIGGLSRVFSGSPIEQQRRTSAEASGSWALPARPTVGQRLPDVESEIEIAVEGDRAFTATTTTFDQQIAGRELVPLEAAAERQEPRLQRGLSTWKITGQTRGRGGLHEDAIMGQMERTMEEMGVELDDATRGMIEGMMGGLLGGAEAASAGEPPQPFTLWYSLDYGLVKMVTAGTTVELFRTYSE